MSPYSENIIGIGNDVSLESLAGFEDYGGFAKDRDANSRNNQNNHQESSHTLLLRAQNTATIGGKSSLVFDQAILETLQTLANKNPPFCSRSRRFSPSSFQVCSIL